MYILRIHAGETRQAHVRKLRTCCSGKGEEGAKSVGVKLRCRAPARSRQRNALASEDATSPTAQLDVAQLQSPIREVTAPRPAGRRTVTARQGGGGLLAVPELQALFLCDANEQA